jgi:Type III restriction enzyme, res subunit
MSELPRGATIDEAEPIGAGGSSDLVSVDVARAAMRAAFTRLMQFAIEFHEIPPKVPHKTASGMLDFNAPPKPIHAAFRITTGVGKSEVARAGLAWYVRKAKIAKGPHRALVLVPTHRLGEEARQRVPVGTTTALWQSRKANDLVTGKPLCSNLPAVEAAELIGADVERTACRKGRRGREPILCPFYKTCGYQAQKPTAKTADILFCAHQHLFSIPKDLIKGVGVVVVDESFWQCGLTFTGIAVDGLDAELESFPVRDHGHEKNDAETAQLRDLIARLQRAIKSLPPGEYLTKAALLAEGLLPGDQYEGGSGAVAAKLELRRRVPADLTPDSSEDIRKARIEEFRFLGQLSRRAAMWRAVEELLSGDDDATGRLRTEIRTTEEGSVLWLRINSRREIHKRIAKLPIVALDATLDIEIVKYYLPRIETLAMTVEAPHEHITQIVGLPVGKSSLSQLEPGKRSPEEEQRVTTKRYRLVQVVRKLAAGRRCLVITHKGLAETFRGIGPSIDVAHFNAIEGIDRWRHVECLITIGRPLPAPNVVEGMAAALTGKPVLHPLQPASRPGGRPQAMVNQNRKFNLKSGAALWHSCKVFERLEAELIRQAVVEAAVVQAAGRARGVNRSADNPVEVWMIMHDTVTPMLVDAVVQFGDLEPTKVDEMIGRGIVPAWAADAAKLYPDLWPTAQAARQAYHRDGLDVARNRRRSVTSPYKESTSSLDQRSVTPPYNYISIRPCHTPLVRYQPAGPGQKSRLALADPSDVEGSRSRIEAALGPLVSFEIITDDHQPGRKPLKCGARSLRLIWGKPRSNLAARRPAEASSTVRQRAIQMRWRVTATAEGLWCSPQ